MSIAGPKHDLREIVNAILYVARTGIPWRYLPHDSPTPTTVYDYFARWEADGTAERVHDALRAEVRRTKGRRVCPTAAVIDSQTVKASPAAPADTVGYDAGKHTKGRKRHIATDTLGLLLVCLATAGSVQDSAGGRQVLTTLGTRHPTVVKAWADGGYNAEVVHPAARLGIDLEIIARDPAVKGFAGLPQRWVVERSFGWFVQRRRLVRAYEAPPERSRAMFHWAMTDTMARRITRVHHRPRQNLQPNPDRSP
ncbi:Transposase IS4 family protein [Carbonactinospora thermoautotrophica]|uniref:Transposase IS4 family protein n=1 Tax=Carbonactinospora thermoautotrophica TaxID=1469144 RepID=A0A132MSN9_9ACTN|nr:Transposase IS4 family protein [Carbonactinospora thermoautotrophica]